VGQGGQILRRKGGLIHKFLCWNCAGTMSALGQKQTFAAQKGMSALTPKADNSPAPAFVRFWTTADIGGFWREMVQSTVRYTELAPGRFKNLWR
jgi:hypothetical protein